MQESSPRLLREQIRLLYQQLPGIIFIPTIGAIFLSAFHWGYIPDENIYAWFLIIFITNSLASSILYFTYKKYKHSNIKLTTWRNWYNSLGLINGLAWGMSAYFLYSTENLILQLVLILYLFSASSIIALTMTAYKMTFYALTVPMLGLIGVKLAGENDILHMLLTLTTIIYMIALYIFHHFVNRSFIDSIQLWIEKNELAKELELRTAEAEKENQAKSRFLAAAGHDLRQPLITQDLLLDSLKSQIGDKNYDDIFIKLKSNINSLHALFNELVEVSRLETSNVIPNIQRVSLSQLLERIKENFIPIANKKNISLNVIINPVHLMSDASLLEKILTNLTSNAIKYTAYGEVNIYSKIDGKQLKIIIQDTGIGIAESEQKSIFYEFYRTQKACITNDGFGLGLTIVKKLSKLLKHELNLESSEDSGTTFTITAPLYPPP